MNDISLVGVDGGASKVLAHRVDIVQDPLRFSPREPHVEVSYETSHGFQAGFQPVPLADQLQEHRAGDVRQREEEAQQEEAILETFCLAIGKLQLSDEGGTVVIGIGLPGLKTPDGRGISAMANGPRMPKFLDRLELMLRQRGVSGLHPVHALGSDADYCGLGEHWGTAGAMRNVRNAYYLGVGTGVADAMLLEGRIVPFDQAKSWIAKTWEMMYSHEHSYENMISAQGIQKRYARETGLSLEDLNRRQLFPWQIFERALEHEVEAATVVETTADALARLLSLRVMTLARGAADMLLVDRSRRLDAEHPYRGSCWDRIVVGQRLGDIWHHHAFRPLLSQPVERKLAELLAESDLPPDMLSRYTDATGRIRTDLVVHSELRNAPALGAAVDAYFNWTE